MLDLRQELPFSVAAYQAVSLMLSMLPFLQTSTTTNTPDTPKGPVGSPDFFCFETSADRLIKYCCYFVGRPYRTGVAHVFSRGHHVISCSTVLRSLGSFGDKASGLRNALVYVMGANSLPRDMKDALRSFLLRLEDNYLALKTHRPIVQQYKNLRDSIDSYNANVMGLLDHIDKLEAEFNILTDVAAELQWKLVANALRQQENRTEQADLHPIQQLIADHQTNTRAIVRS